MNEGESRKSLLPAQPSYALSQPTHMLLRQLGAPPGAPDTVLSISSTLPTASGAPTRYSRLLFRQWQRTGEDNREQPGPHWSSSTRRHQRRP